MKRKLTPLEKAAIEFELATENCGVRSPEFDVAVSKLDAAALAFARRYRREAEKGKKR